MTKQITGSENDYHDCQGSQSAVSDDLMCINLSLAAHGYQAPEQDYPWYTVYNDDGKVVEICNTKGELVEFTHRVINGYRPVPTFSLSW